MNFRVLLIILCLPATLAGQSLELDVESPTTNNSPDTFALNGGEVRFTGNTIRFLENDLVIQGFAAWGVSPDLSVVGLVHWTAEGNTALLMSAAGDTLVTYETVRFSERDPSLALFPSNNGSMVIRENVSSFTFYDTFGESGVTVAGGTQGTGGSTMPRVSMDPAGKTVVIWSPKVKTAGGIGSSVQRVESGNRLEDIFYSDDRFIRFAEVSEDGQFIVLVTAREGSDDRIVLIDRYGNRLTEIDTEEEVEGATLSAEADYLTVYSERRVVVYSTPEGERVRSASSSAPLIRAAYFDEDRVILGVTGTLSGQSGLMNGVEFYAVDLERGQIARESLGFALGFGTNLSGTAFSPVFRRNGPGSYTLLGGSRQITVRTGF